MTKKAVPNIFNSIKNLYIDPKKVEIVEKIALTHLNSLKQNL